MNNIFVTKIKGWNLQVKVEIKISVNHFPLSPMRFDNLKEFVGAARRGRPIREPLNRIGHHFIKIFQNTPQLCWGDEWPP